MIPLQSTNSSGILEITQQLITILLLSNSLLHKVKSSILLINCLLLQLDFLLELLLARSMLLQ